MKKPALGIGKRDIVFLLVLSLVVIFSAAVIVHKDKVISQLRSDLLKSQMLTVLQHNDNELLQARLTDLEEKSGQKK